MIMIVVKCRRCGEFKRVAADTTSIYHRDPSTGLPLPIWRQFHSCEDTLGKTGKGKYGILDVIGHDIFDGAETHA